LEQAAHVQRLFSMFPPGLPGFGLLLLRASVAVALLLEQYAYRGTLSTSVSIAWIVLSVAISAGYMTPIVTALALLCHALIWVWVGGTDVASILIVALDAIALALLGPGAYSIDAYRFGRRVVVLPPS
jgi:hypothetical protein